MNWHGNYEWTKWFSGIIIFAPTVKVEVDFVYKYKVEVDVKNIK